MRSQGGTAAGRANSARGAVNTATKTVGARASSGRGSAMKRGVATTSAAKIQNESTQDHDILAG